MGKSKIMELLSPEEIDEIAESLQGALPPTDPIVVRNPGVTPEMAASQYCKVVLEAERRDYCGIPRFVG